VDFTDYAPSMWFASNSDLRCIAWAMLGLDATDAKTTGDADAEPKNDAKPTANEALSPIERSLAQLFIEQLAVALNDGWMGGEPINLQTGTIAFDPRKARFFRENDLVTVTSIQVGLKAGPVGINWLLSKQKTCDLLENAIDLRDDAAPPSEPQRPPAHLIGQLPIEVVSILGTAMLPMSQLSQLKVGQLIELDQRIDQPVVAVVNEVPFYEGWPGRRGKNQAIEVTRCLHQ
ncbi:MAG: FliM/FliN family flagellar motor switch protein, partial [Pirellulaceae bacterium]